MLISLSTTVFAAEQTQSTEQPIFIVKVLDGNGEEVSCEIVDDGEIEIPIYAQQLSDGKTRAASTRAILATLNIARRSDTGLVEWWFTPTLVNPLACLGFTGSTSAYTKSGLSLGTRNYWLPTWSAQYFTTQQMGVNFQGQFNAIGYAPGPCNYWVGYV